MRPPTQKESGAYYTPDHVSDSLLQWVIRAGTDRLLDPSCGDGQFIAGHRNAVGIEQDPVAARRAVERAPSALVHEGEFFSWAANTTERFECSAGNPPFIRYQTFRGETRERALALCARMGAQFTGLTSSWAPFLVAAASLLREGGRMAYVVPAEIGHAPYSAPLLEYLVANFAVVHVVAVRDKLFPSLSEDCWLLYADGHGSQTSEIRFSALESFKQMTVPPGRYARVPVGEWRTAWACRLRPYLLATEARSLYQDARARTRKLGELATVGIGYVTGANDFFHLRPSDARKWGIPEVLLHPTVRKGSVLPQGRLTQAIVNQWWKDDQQMLLLKIPKSTKVPAAVKRYLDTVAGQAARGTYKCRSREPWYSVPDVQVPDFFLSYMSGWATSLVRNEAACTCTNSLHSVRLTGKASAHSLARAWNSDFVKLSTELEGHPLGGGMLKLEPREATNIAVPTPAALRRFSAPVIEEALSTMRLWRHYAATQ